MPPFGTFVALQLETVLIRIAAFAAAEVTDETGFARGRSDGGSDATVGRATLKSGF